MGVCDSRAVPLLLVGMRARPQLTLPRPRRSPSHGADGGRFRAGASAFGSPRLSFPPDLVLPSPRVRQSPFDCAVLPGYTVTGPPETQRPSPLAAPKRIPSSCLVTAAGQPVDA